MAVHSGAADRGRCGKPRRRMRRVGGPGWRVPGDEARRPGHQVGQEEEQTQHELRQAQVSRSLFNIDMNG